MLHSKKCGPSKSPLDTMALIGDLDWISMRTCQGRNDSFSPISTHFDIMMSTKIVGLSLDNRTIGTFCHSNPKYIKGILHIEKDKFGGTKYKWLMMFMQQNASIGQLDIRYTSLTL